MMNAIQFAVLILIGVVCANVSAISQPKEVSKETKLGISDPKTATANGIGAQLDVVVDTYASESNEGSAIASRRPTGPTGTTYTSSYSGTGGNVIASGTNSSASSDSGGSGNSTNVAVASPRAASARGIANGGANTTSGGSAVETPERET